MGRKISKAFFSGPELKGFAAMPKAVRQDICGTSIIPRPKVGSEKLSNNDHVWARIESSSQVTASADCKKSWDNKYKKL